MFWQKKSENKQDTSECYKIIQGFAVEMVKLKAEIERLDRHYFSLKGLINRKRGFVEEEEDPEEETPEHEDDGFDSVRNLKKTLGNGN